MLQAITKTTVQRTLAQLARQQPFYICSNPPITRRLFSSSYAIKVKMGSPVILCGKTEAIGQGVIETLEPECDVIHFVMTPQGGVTQIPAILKGDKSVPADSELGSKDYSKPPVAVILGGGYTDDDIEIMFKASAGIRPIPWLRPDLTKPAPPLGPEYGKALVKRIKDLLVELEREGKMNTEQVVWY